MRLGGWGQTATNLNSERLLSRNRFPLLRGRSPGDTHLAEFEFPAKHDLAISHVRGLPMAQGWVSRLVDGLKYIPASKSAATRCPLGSYELSKSVQKVRVI